MVECVNISIQNFNLYPTANTHTVQHYSHSLPAVFCANHDKMYNFYTFPPLHCAVNAHSALSVTAPHAHAHAHAHAHTHTHTQFPNSFSPYILPLTQPEYGLHENTKF